MNFDRNKKRLLEIRAIPGNSVCADCEAADPCWTSYTLGIFICLNCSGIHRDLSAISKVKSIQLDNWDDDQVQFMKEHGNLLAKAKYEAKVPLFYYKPRSQDCPILIEQWIRAKYEREGFTAEKDINAWYLSGFKEGFLWKRGKGNQLFQQRRFVLSETEGDLKYYIRPERNENDGRRSFISRSNKPKSIIKLRDLNATFQPKKIGHRNGLAIIFVKDSQTRTIFVYHENAEDIVDWYNAIRAARLRYLKTAFPSATESELIPKITRNYVKEGYMEKTGPTHREPFKKRWFTLDSLERKLLYYISPMDPVEHGGVFIGSSEHGYKVTEFSPNRHRASKWKTGITIETPERNFLLTCPSATEQREWIEALTDIISRQMTPQDYTAEANLRQRQ